VGKWEGSEESLFPLHGGISSEGQDKEAVAQLQAPNSTSPTEKAMG
jgi:hypothetical protein